MIKMLKQIQAVSSVLTLVRAWYAHQVSYLNHYTNLVDFLVEQE